MEYTFGTSKVPTNIEELFNTIGITTYREMSTVKDKITENVCKKRISKEYFIERFQKLFFCKQTSLHLLRLVAKIHFGHRLFDL